MANSDGFAPISPADTTVEDKGLDELREEMDRNVNEFFATAVKMKIGDRNAGFDNDIKRIEAARQQGWTGYYLDGRRQLCTNY